MSAEQSGKQKTLRQLRTEAAEYLKSRGIAEADVDAQLLMEKVFGFSKSEFFMRADEPADEAPAQRLWELLEQRGKRIPLQYILQEAWFYGRSFYVNPDVLIPRMDTEVLVEEALKVLRKGMRVLDMCTGSGCILLTLVLESGAVGVGADISEKALDVAEENARRLQADCSLVQSDLFSKIEGQFDVIVSNPPYIQSRVIDTLEPEVRDFEPHLALDGGEDGLEFYRRIIAGAKEHLHEGGRLFLEIGYDESEQVLQLLAENGFRDGRITKDLSGLPRVAVGVAE